MELRHYLRILRRSWPLLVGLPALVAFLTLAVSMLLPPRYTITAAVLITQRPIGTREPVITLPDENNFYSWTASEFVVDDIPQIVETRRFADDIAAWLQAEHAIRVRAEHISDGLEAERRHRMVYLHVTADRADHARLIAQGAIEMLEQNGLQYWGRGDSTELLVAQHELPEKAESLRGLRSLAVDLVLRSMLALVLAVGLAFLRHYLDQSLHRPSEVESLGLEVVGAIPAEGHAEEASLPRRGVRGWPAFRSR